MHACTHEPCPLFPTHSPYSHNTYFSHPKDITSTHSSHYIEKGIEVFFNPDSKGQKGWNDEAEEEEDNCHGGNEDG